MNMKRSSAAFKAREREALGLDDKPSSNPKEDPQEADITISGIKLTAAQSMTVRVAIQSFAIHCEHALKQDASATNLYKGYMARINDLNELIAQSAR
jgi:hypothetical protein